MNDISNKAHSIYRRQDFVGGVVLLILAAATFWLSGDLAFGTLQSVGPGLVPRSVAVILGLLACLLIVLSLQSNAEEIDGWSPRALVFIIGSFVIFGLAIRPLGLAVAAPLAVLLSSFASQETRLGETVCFSVLMTAFCAALFKYALGLPIPLAPWLLGY